MFWLLFASFLLMVLGHTGAEECKKDKFKQCLLEVGLENSYYFKDNNGSQEFKDHCPDRLESVKCAKKYGNLCTTPEQYFIWSSLQSGIFKAVEDLCTEGTDLNEAYLKNLDCLPKMEKDVEFCNAKYAQSMNLITTDTSLKEHFKMFHYCCAYDWVKACRMRAAEVICDEDTKNYIAKVSDVQVGIAMSTCAAGFSQIDNKCFDLYGVDVGRPDGLFSSGSMLSASIVIPFLILLFVWFM